MAKEMVVVKWTRDKPTAPGWYWYRETTHLAPGENPHGIVYLSDDRFTVNFTATLLTLVVAQMVGEWAGPLVPPEE